MAQSVESRSCEASSPESDAWWVGGSDSIAASLSSFSKPLSVRVRLRTPTRFCRLPATCTTSEVVSRGKCRSLPSVRSFTAREPLAVP